VSKHQPSENRKKKEPLSPPKAKEPPVIVKDPLTLKLEARSMPEEEIKKFRELLEALKIQKPDLKEDEAPQGLNPLLNPEKIR
jgi:hypothetical protein